MLEIFLFVVRLSWNAALSLGLFFNAGNTLLTRQVLPPGTILSNLTGHALWQTFVNETVDIDKKGIKSRGRKQDNLARHRQVQLRR